jgi:hypothetical protein
VKPDLADPGPLDRHLEPLADLRAIERSSRRWVGEYEVIVGLEHGVAEVVFQFPGQLVGERHRAHPGRRLGRGCQRGVGLRPPLAVVIGTAGFAELADDVAATLLRDPLTDLRFSAIPRK